MLLFKVVFYVKVELIPIPAALLKLVDFRDYSNIHPDIMIYFYP